MCQEVKRGCKPEILGENDKNAKNEYFCFDSSYDLAKNAVQKLALVLHSPQCSFDLKES
jgi:hypothetical protein